MKQKLEYKQNLFLKDACCSIGKATSNVIGTNSFKVETIHRAQFLNLRGVHNREVFYSEGGILITNEIGRPQVTLKSELS